MDVENFIACRHSVKIAANALTIKTNPWLATSCYWVSINLSASNWSVFETSGSANT